MKNEILQTIQQIVVALNGVSVSGKGNLGNLYGSINALEMLSNKIIDLEIVDPSDKGDE